MKSIIHILASAAATAAFLGVSLPLRAASPEAAPPTDVSPPVILCVSDATLQCDQAPDPATTGRAMALDAMDPQPTITFSDTVTAGNCPVKQIVTRTWLAADHSGNSTSCVQRISLVDSRPPVLVCPADVTLECGDATAPTATGEATATDNCGPTVALVHADVEGPVSCPQEKVIFRTWTATDDCGNQISCIQHITVLDREPPLVACPPAVSIECDVSTDPASVGQATATDACDPQPMVGFSDSYQTATCPESLIIIRRWTATDACGNIGFCNQRITVLDLTPPVLNCPPDVTVECGQPTDPPATGQVTAIDNCDLLFSIIYTDSVTPGACATERVISRTWTARDDCQNTSSCTQHITVADSTPPVLTHCPPDLTVGCGEVPEPNVQTIVATDACQGWVTVRWAGDDRQGETCPNRYTILRTYDAADACGNVATCTQIITVNDQTPPLIVCPPPLTVDCDEMVPAPNVVDVLATDQCPGDVTVVWLEDQISGQTCPHRYTVMRTYQATDVCGNTAVCAQTITVEDQVPPVVTCPASVTVDCAADVPAPNTGLVSATDNCQGDVTVEWVGDEISAESCPNRYLVARRYQATDICGNTATCTQTITVDDQVPPVSQCAADREVECGDTWDFDPPSATDNCSAQPVQIHVVMTITNQQPGTVFMATRTWIAVDACGNEATCHQTIRVLDTTPPISQCPENISVPCVDASGAPVNFTTSATDVCDPAPTVLCVPPSSSVFALGTTTVSCLATDASGNQSQCVFTVTVYDHVPPQIVCPADEIVSELPTGSGSAVVNYPAPQASDNCDPHPTVICQPAAGTAFAVGNTVVTCIASDASGNSNSCTFVVTVIPYTITVSSLADSGPGSLRQALINANDSPEPNLIVFALPGPAPHTIHLLSPLPEITDSVTIDGWSELEFNGAPVVELDGSQATLPTAAPPGTTASPVNGGVDGLVLTSGGNIVRGLVLHGFATGIRVAGPGGNVIAGNFLGPDAAGTAARGNSEAGIYVSSAGNVIGGAAPGSGNVISGNAGSGIWLAGVNAVSNLVQGNLIGTATNGTSALGNGLDGVTLDNGAARNTIGGSTNGAGNRIAFNGRNGVTLEPAAGTDNAILGNAIFANAELGIDLGADGQTANDPGDADTGPNNVQNAPVLDSIQTVGGLATIQGSLNGAAHTIFRLEFFVNDTAGTAGPSEGQTLIGTGTVTTDASGAGNFAVNVPLVLPQPQFITATATDPDGNTSEFSVPVLAGGAPVIIEPPQSAQSTVGGMVMFCVDATGGQPLRYQWRHNGVNIPGATDVCLIIPSAALSDGGSYSVVVLNDYGAVVSSATTLALQFTVLSAGDNFVDRVPLSKDSGTTSGNNFTATREPGEPTPAGKTGGKSVWYTWRAPAMGIATFVTLGSTFDTLLGVYTGTSVDQLTVVDSDEDRGGFYTSRIRFNTVAGKDYHILIDGFGGAVGSFVFNWEFEATSSLLPVIRSHPVNLTVPPGATATFAVDAIGVCKYTYNKDGKYAYRCQQHGHVLTYQWFLNGQPLPGATNAMLTIPDARPEVVGNYTVQVTQQTRTVDSLPASLQLNVTGFSFEDAHATDKFLDAVLAPNPLILGAPPGASGVASFSVVSGYSGSQVFNTAGSATELNEEPICDVAGGASQWLSFVPQETGDLFLNTDGSSFDTVIAVAGRDPAHPNMLTVLGCDNNSGLDGQDSALVVPVRAGETNYIVVDGVNGATGILKLNFSLVTTAHLTPLGKNAQGANQLRLTGRPDMRFTIQASSNLVQWFSLLTTNSPLSDFDFLDPVPKRSPPRFYRALMMP